MHRRLETTYQSTVCCRLDGTYDDVARRRPQLPRARLKKNWKFFARPNIIIPYFSVENLELFQTNSASLKSFRLLNSKSLIFLDK